MRSQTVNAYVDTKVRRLVDAINLSEFDVHTVGCCSGHRHKPGFPYVAFRSGGWPFVQFALEAVSALNAVTRAGAKLLLLDIQNGMITGRLDLNVCPWLFPRTDWAPLFRAEVNPPASLVRLWWLELDELAAMVEEKVPRPSSQFVTLLQEPRRLWESGRRSGLTAWLRRRASRPGS